MIMLAFDSQTYGKVTAMRARGLSLCLACIVALLVLSPPPASAQPSALGAGGVTTGTYEEVGYRYRGRYGIARVIGDTDIIAPITDPTMVTTVDPTTVMALAIGPTGVQVSACGLASRLTERTS